MKNDNPKEARNKIPKNRPRKNNKRTLRKTKEKRTKTEMIIDCTHLSISSFTYKNKKYILVALYSPKHDILARVLLDKQQAEELKIKLRELLEENYSYG